MERFFHMCVHKFGLRGGTMDRHRSWDDIKRSRPQPSAETRAAIEREVDEVLAAEVERVRADENFTQRAERLIERDGELINRLAE